jgi:nucleoside-diphosphate-sugar epimerase
MKTLLITGITGLIGKAVLKSILERKPDLKITALVRPGTGVDRFALFVGSVDVVEQDLADVSRLRMFLANNRFDIVMHIGALRGGRDFSRSQFLRANLHSTQQIIEYCKATGAQLIFCSSVGVFGAIPSELPANNQTYRNADNLYHSTKIDSEKAINRAVLTGLKAAILRPAITYGPGDHGFPFQMVKLVHKRRFPLSNKRVWIHLCHVETIAMAFVWLLENEWESGLSLNIADREPVQLSALVNFISRQLSGKNYRPLLKIDRRILELGEKIAKLLRNELWISRFQLISRSWFYDVRPAYELMDLPQHYTIPDLQSCINYYLGK